MKAWNVYLEGEFCGLFHAETRGQAKMAFIDAYGLDVIEFIDVGARRVIELDDKPITYENAKSAGFYARKVGFDDYVHADNSWELEYIKKEEFINDCHCKICRGE